MSDRTLRADERTVSSQSALALEATLATGGGSKDTHEAGRGSLIDRYVVLDLAGAGAMGMVLVAYDPELDRKIAVKLLKLSDDTARARLQREAQALAKLDHPNVVAVYDVGTHDGQLFMAMEFVQGKTLGRWMSEAHSGPHAWAEVVRVFGEAGRGLAAAHAAWARAPRLQARERDDGRRRSRAGHGLWPRARDLAGNGVGRVDQRVGVHVAAIGRDHDAHGGGDGHAGIHVARAIQGQADGRSL